MSNGYGRYHHSDGTSYYEGEWKDDKHHGLGKEVWNDGAIYEGQYSHGFKNGYGNFKWQDGSYFVGFFL